MAIVSAGYQGQIGTDQWGTLAPKLGRTYSVEGANDFAISTLTGGSLRMSTIAAGTATGKGIADVSDSSVDITYPQLSSGTRYDMVVLRRDWATKSTSIVVIQGATPRQLPQRFQNPGVRDDQPLWLVRLEAGSSAPQEYIDLRAWNTDGGLLVRHELALSYFTDPGTQVRLGDDLYTRILNGSGTSGLTAALDRRPLAGSPLDLFDSGGRLSGSLSSTSRVLVQGGTAAEIPNANGYYRLYFPTPFPNGLLTFLPANGDAGAAPFAAIEVAGSSYGVGDRTSVVLRFQRLGGSASNPTRETISGSRVRVNWIALGF